MTLLSRSMALFPGLVLGLAALFVYLLAWRPGPLPALGLGFVLYVLPVLTYRVHDTLFPLEEGISYLKGSEYSAWWGGHQCQVIYIAFPALEAALRLVPGVFSAWLRAWGSRVGKDVYWTPGLEIADRAMLEIGDRAVFGHRIGLYPHVIKPRRGDLMLFVKRIHIGSDVFLGAGSHLGPGVVVADGAYVPVATDLYPNEKRQE